MITVFDAASLPVPAVCALRLVPPAVLTAPPPPPDCCHSPDGRQRLGKAVSFFKLLPRQQPRRYLGSDNPLLGGAVLCVAGCSVASLASPHDIKVAAARCDNQNVPRRCQVFPRRAKLPPVETCWLQGPPVATEGAGI